jgi:hypothetical protein
MHGGREKSAQQQLNKKKTEAQTDDITKSLNMVD